MIKSNDCPLISNDEVALADEALASELLKDLDLDGPNDSAAVVTEFVATSPALRAVMAKQADRQREKSRKQSKPSSKFSAVEERKRYAEEKGTAPRPYNRNDIAPKQPHESDDEYQRRYKREYARIMRGVATEDIEACQFTREVTTPEQTKRKRADAEKQRRANMTREEKDAENARKKRKRDEAKERDKAATEAALATRRIF
jgi:hypothetical protein